MPIQRELKDGVLRTTISSYVTLDDVWQHINQSRLSGQFACPELVDARTASPISLSVNDMMKIAGLVKSSLGDHTPGRRAIIVNTEENCRLARAFATIASAWIPVAIFEDPAKAERWLAPSGEFLKAASGNP